MAELVDALDLGSSSGNRVGVQLSPLAPTQFLPESCMKGEIMQVAVKDISSVKKMLHIEISEDKIVDELDMAYRELKKKAKIKGYRPGKTPRSVLERLFKKDVYADVSSRLLQSSLVDAIKETDLKIVGNPMIDSPEFDGKGPYKYNVTVEVNPEIEEIDFKGLTLKRKLYRVSDEDVEAQLKMLQKNLAQQKTVEETRAVRRGDFALINYEGFKDEKPFSETKRTENFTLKVGSGHILKDFDEKLIGMKPGDNREIRVNFPEDYFNNRLANLEIVFQVKLNEIREEVLPEIDDKFAMELGEYKTLDELKKTIVDNLKQGYAKRVEQELNEQIFTALIAKTDFEMPDSMVDHELQGIVADAERSFAYHDTSMEKLGLTREELSEKYRDTAEKQVRRHIILNKIIEQENLTLSEENVKDGFKEMARNLERPVEEIEGYYKQKKDGFEVFQQALLAKHAIRLIIENSSIEDVDSSVIT